MENRPDEIGIVPAGTLVVWMICMGVGLVKIQQSTPAGAGAPSRIVEAELLRVRAGDGPASAPGHGPAEEIQVVPVMRAMAKAAEPARFLSPALLAAPATVAEAPAAAAAVRELVYGRGEGNQPAPEYPIEAQLDGEEGTVVVRFDVAADGHVESAAVVTACDWPVLNRAAARSIENTWRFRAGAARSYLVSIVYRIKAH